MNRQVDVKALVSHIIRGDGLDKCRICMGDTSQGQVHLGDTVMMDGDKPVSLSELLELITGVTVTMEDSLPVGVCIECYGSAAQAGDFRATVQNAQHHWNNMTQLLQTVPEYQYSKKTDRVTAVLYNNNLYISEKNTKVPSQGDYEYGLPLKRIGKQHDCSCPNCGKAFSYPLHLYKHLKESADLVRACHLCARIMTRDNLVKHLKDIHLIKPYNCTECPALYLHEVQFKKHILEAHAPGACTCGDCGRSFKSISAYHAHQAVHYLRACPNCDVQFHNRTCFLHHIRKCCNIDAPRKRTKSKTKLTVRLPQKQNKELKIGLRGSSNKECICDYCKKTFAGKRFVAAHIQIVHTKRTHKPCVQCGKQFAAAHMPTHMKTHMPAATFECNICGVKLKTKLGYSQHVRIHTGEKPYVCKFCGESFSASSRRSEHILSTHRKREIALRHGCSFCPARFRVPHKLKNHVSMVHGDKGTDEWEWKCGKCKEKFKSCRSLVHHSRNHKS